MTQPDTNLDSAQQYVALLRGINVGGHRMQMARLCVLFTELGFTAVRSYIASGNIIFRSERSDVATMETQIAAHLQQGLGYAVPTFIRTPAELRAVVGFTPFAPADMETPGYTIHAAFLHAAPSVEHTAALLALATSYDAFAVQGREYYWLCRGRSSDTLVPDRAWARAFPLPATMRNMTMLRKLIPLLDEKA